MRTVFMGVAAMILLFMAGNEIWIASEEKSMARSSDAPSTVAKVPELSVVEDTKIVSSDLTPSSDNETPAVAVGNVSKPTVVARVDPLPEEPLGVDDPPTLPIIISSRESALPEPERIVRPIALSVLSSQDNSFVPEIESTSESQPAKRQPIVIGLLLDRQEQPSVDLETRPALVKQEPMLKLLSPSEPEPEETKTEIEFLPRSIYKTPKRDFPQVIAQEALQQIAQENSGLAIIEAKPLSRPLGLSEAPKIAQVEIKDFAIIESLDDLGTLVAFSASQPPNRGFAESDQLATAFLQETLPVADETEPVKLKPEPVIEKTDTIMLLPLIDPNKTEPAVPEKAPAADSEPAKVTKQPVSEKAVPKTQAAKKKTTKKKVVKKKKNVAKLKLTAKGSALTSAERSKLARSISKCFRAPASAKAKPDLRVRMRVSLTKDGFITSSPKMVSGGGSGTALEIYNAARRALIRCQPFDLPVAKYQDWRSISVTASASSIGAR